MDFQSLARKDLQALCKKNKIPANMTNLAMADALKSLKSMEWDDEIKQRLMPQSGALENHGSPLPRSRRVTAMSSETASLSIEEQIDQQLEELKHKYNSIDAIDSGKTPTTAVRRSQRVQSTATKKTGTVTTGTAGTVTGTTRGRKKQEETAVGQTPATRRTTRTAVKKAGEASADVAVPKSTTRTTRQSSRRPAESVNTARVTRNRAKMMSLEDETETVETETVIAPLKEVETTETETEIAPLKEVETAATETIPLKEVETIETEITPLKEAESTEPASDEKLAEVEEVEEHTELKEQEEEAQLVSDEKMDSVEEETEQIVAKLESDVSALSIENSTNEEVKEEKELMNETPDQKVAEVEEPIEETIAELHVEKTIAEEQVEEILAEEQIEETIAEQKVGELTAEEADLTDSPIMGIVSEPIQEEVTTKSSSDITLDAMISTGEDEEKETTGEECILSPVRPAADPAVDRMMDSVVRHFAKASIHDSRSNVKAKKVEKEAVVSSENEVKEKSVVDLNCMSLRKLKAIYKEQQLHESKDAKAVEVRRPALAELNDNLLA